MSDVERAMFIAGACQNQEDEPCCLDTQRLCHACFIRKLILAALSDARSEEREVCARVIATKAANARQLAEKMSECDLKQFAMELAELLDGVKLEIRGK